MEKAKTFDCSIKLLMIRTALRIYISKDLSRNLYFFLNNVANTLTFGEKSGWNQEQENNAMFFSSMQENSLSGR
jgi:hypothetical protein